MNGAAKRAETPSPNLPKKDLLVFFSLIIFLITILIDISLNKGTTVHQKYENWTKIYLSSNIKP